MECKMIMDAEPVAMRSPIRGTSVPILDNVARAPLTLEEEDVRRHNAEVDRQIAELKKIKRSLGVDARDRGDPSIPRPSEGPRIISDVRMDPPMAFPQRSKRGGRPPSVALAKEEEGMLPRKQVEKDGKEEGRKGKGKVS